MKIEDIIQAANEYVGHAEEVEEDLSTYRNIKSFEAGAKWMQEKMIDKATEWLKHNIYDYFYWIEMEGESEANIKDTLYDDFKKAMKQ